MRPIGWSVTCVLLAIVFAKNSLSAGTRLRHRLPANQTESLPISNETSVRPHGQEIENVRRVDFDGNADTRAEGAEGRTFGHKRIQFMLMPMMYKMGVMTTMLTALMFISLKGVLIGIILLILKLGTLIGKFSSGWQHQPPSWHGWPAQPAQPIHLHLHNSHPTGHGQPYHGWIPDTAPGDEEHYYYKG